MNKKLTVSDVSFLLSQWDYEKNVDLVINKLSASSHKPANWHCKKCGYEWECSIKSRYEAKGKCPVCDSGKVILPGINDVFTRIPELKETYDFEKNKGFDIEHQGVNSEEVVWWKCDECAREWKSSILGRRAKCEDGSFRANKCLHLTCTTRKKNRPIAEASELMRFWDTDKNKDIDIYVLSANSKKVASWKCDNCGYEWISSIKDRYDSPGLCPACEQHSVVIEGISDIFTLVEGLKNYYDFEKNSNIDITTLTVSTKRPLFWKCPECGHEWESTIPSRINRIDGKYVSRGCHQCYLHDKNRITSVATIHSLVKFWDFEKNTDKDINLTSAHSNETAHWKCQKCGYEWEASIKGRTGGIGKCPYCEEHKPVLYPGKNDVLTLCPSAAKYFDTSKNASIDLGQVYVGSKMEMDFKCPICSREWRAPLNSRIIKQNDGTYRFKDCSCHHSGRRTKTYAEQYPRLKSIYDKDRNPKPLADIQSTEIREKYHWMCDICGESYYTHFHSVIAAIKNTNTIGCPYCSHTLLRKGESFADVHPELVAEFDESNTIDIHQVFPASKIEASWKCLNDPSHQWQATFAARHIGSGRCPICYPTMVKPGVNSLKAIYNDIADMWSDRNERTADEILYNSSLYVYLNCPECHMKFSTFLKDFISGKTECPYCAEKRVLPGVNSLADKYPNIAQMWSPNNEKAASEVWPNNGKWALWICPECKGEFRAQVNKVVDGSADCPYCADRLVLYGLNSYADKYKEASMRWSSSNDTLPTDHLHTANYPKLFICDECGGEYFARMQDVVNGTDECPYCADKKVLPGLNSFQARHPDLIEEWDHVNNYIIADPDAIGDKNNTQVWWICTNNHSHHYPMSVKDKLTYQIRHKESCPYCKGRRRKKRHFV